MLLNLSVIGNAAREENVQISKALLLKVNALLWNLTSYLLSAAARQHRTEQPRPGPTRACTHFTYFNKTAITKKLSHLKS